MNFEPKKHLGQNFLLDTDIIRIIIDNINLEDGEEFIEIGPGHGVLTQMAASRIKGKDKKIYAVEIDERFCRKLETMFLEDPGIIIICKDVLDYLPEFSPKGEFKIFGSLPYYITSPIIHGVIKMKKQPKQCVFLIQKEVAEKINCKAPDSSYLSSFVQTFYEVAYLGKVPADRFDPKPEVDGGIISLERKNISYNSDFVSKYEGFLHRAYSHPRKMLNKIFTKEELEKGGINPSIRAQNLDSQQWLNFFSKLNPALYEI
ncbi:MAG TPA: 16S rRNA (adenine(1518)-N(6)/adenine(1519)-N(6))-dimethyltransferase RsmA [bacterium]|nr:16S rRNA (adenine(1518)-N(6)/adenine(1519)-N(6))-dimethyltransferase RsmA [bacterium]